MKPKYIHLILLSLIFISAVNFRVLAEAENYSELVGKWVRPDGGYTLIIKDVSDEGNIDAVYLNPNNINVSKAQANIEKDQIKIYVEMQDIGYPGSNYRLRYDKKNDRLVGVYYHAVLKKDFNIYFVRKEAKEKSSQ